MMMPMTRASSMIGPPSLSETTMASRPMSMASFGVTAIPPRRGSNRHAQDVLIRLDDAVAHRRHRLQRDLGIGHRGDHLGDVGLAGHRPDAPRLALLERADSADRLPLDENGESANILARRHGWCSG